MRGIPVRSRWLVIVLVAGVLSLGALVLSIIAPQEQAVAGEPSKITASATETTEPTNPADRDLPLSGARVELPKPDTSEISPLRPPEASLQEPWRNPNRERAIVGDTATRPGQVYIDLLDEGTVDDTFVSTVEQSGWFNPLGVSLTPTQRDELKVGLKPLQAERFIAGQEESKRCVEACNRKEASRDYAQVLKTRDSQASITSLYETHMKSNLGGTWKLNWTNGEIRVIVVRADEAPEVFAAKHRKAVADDAAVEYVFGFFERVFNGY